jgi:hypothetical protein
MFVVMCRCMLEAFESFGDVSRHGYVNGGANIVPAQSHGEIERAGQIGCDGVEVNGVVAVGVFNSEIVNNECEGDVPGGMGP